MRILLSAIVVALLMAEPAGALMISGGEHFGDFELITAEDISQAGPLVVAGTATISGANVILDAFRNNFRFNQANSFTGNTSLSVFDTDAIRASVFSNGTGKLWLTAGGEIRIDALQAPRGSAQLLSFGPQLGGFQHFDVTIRDAQDISVGGTLTINARNIIFEFSDGQPADLNRLNVGQLFLFPGSGGEVLARSSVPVIPVPEPTSLALLLAGLAVLGFAVRRRNRGPSLALTPMLN